jgi:subtilisin-like proprotein convertase family protein
MKKLNYSFKTGLFGALFLLLGAVAFGQPQNITMTWQAGTFPNEDGWEIISPTNTVVFCEPAGGVVPPANTVLSLNPGTYTVRGYDSFGDGWNGSQLRFAQGAAFIGNPNPMTLASGGFTNTCPGVPQTGTIIGTFTVAVPCALTCPPSQTVANTTGTCGAVINYSINTGSCTDPVTLSPNLPSGSVFPVGTTVVTATSGIANCSFSVTVTDEDDPTFAPCPADIIVTLDPGACSAFVNCNVKAIDNCPYQGPLQSLVQYNSNSIDLAGALACYIAPTSYWRVYNLNQMGVSTDFLLQSVTTAVVNANNTNFTIRAHRLNGAFTLANLTLLGSKTQALTGNNVYRTIAFDTPIQLPAGSTFVIEIALTPVAPFGPAGQNQLGEAFPTYISAPACGITNPVTQSSLGFAYVGLFHPNGNVFQDEIPLTNNSEIDPLTGDPYDCGDEFPIGDYNMSYTATDAAGNSANCNFQIIVNEFPNPTNTLACNDNVQISLDEDGCVEVLADMILEGGPYGCYDDYIVEVLNQFGFPAGNEVCCNLVGQTRTVRVTDPATGNKCWGTISIMDKLPPVIECRNITISCTEEIPNLPAPAVEGLFLEVIEGLNDIIENPIVLEYEFDLSNFQPGSTVLDVDARIKLTGHTWLPDLTLTLIDPSGQSVNFLTIGGCVGQEWPIDAWFDDEGITLTQCAALNAAGAHLQGMVAGVSNNTLFSQFDGNDASGVWTIRITDSFPADDGVVETVGLKVEVPDFVQVDPSDNCDWEYANPPYVETASPGDCNGPSEVITRVWTVVDPSGNTASCTQTITRARPTLADVELPPHYDGIDLAVLDCSGSGWDINGNGYPDVSETGGPTITGVPFVNGDVCNLTYSYTDTKIDICGDSYKVLRKWLIIDWCTAEQATYDQLIKVLDQNGPSVDCPDGPVTINVYQSSYQQGGPHTICKGTVVIPALTVLGDDCSGLNPAGYVTQLWTLGAGTLLQSIPGNGGTFTNVELIADNPPTNNAQYTVRHVFTDACGNQSDCIYDITVVDKVPPVPICDEITELALTNNGASGEGCSTLPASDLDDGSYDNCGDVYFYAAKMNPFLTPPYFYQYYPELEFCCDEVGDNMVIVLVLDFDPATIPGATLPDGSIFLFPGNPIFEGSFNTCMVTVGVTDKIPPVTLFCPANQTITCDTYLQNYAAGVEQGNYSVLDGFGSPQFYDNCDFDLTSNVNVNLNNCTEGTITRSWTASDANGQATCTQVITVTHVNNWEVLFPADVTAVCTNGQLPDTGEPEIFFDECELIGVSHSDQLFTVVPDACYKIVRTWTVINWCVYDPSGNNSSADDILVSPRRYRSGPDGYVTYKQTIKVMDNEDPTFTVDPIDGCIVDTDCDTDITLPYPNIDDDCSLSFDVDITGDFGTFNNITGAVTIPNVGVGEYEVTYAVTDNCGNTGYLTLVVVVEDCKKPTPLCDNGLVVEIMQTGMVEVCAEAFDEGSFDNCGPIAHFSYSPDITNTCQIFDCDDVLVNPTVQIWVTDIYGNQDFCETVLIVQDNMGACNNATGPTIAGAIATEGNQGVEGVDVQVNGGLFSTLTNLSGDFTFNGLPAGGDYTVAPMLDENPGNGVTTYDLVLISRHILGIQNLNSPYKVIAADANKSNSVTTLDMVVIRKVILQIEPGFANNTSWRFVNKDFVFANPANPFAAQFPEVINYNNMTLDDLNADFVAIKVGDVNGSAATNVNGDVEDRSFNGTLDINVEEQQLKAGKTYQLAFTAPAAEVLGYQFTLNMSEAVEVVDLIGGVASEENFGMLLEEGAITTSWNVSEARALAQGEVLFTLVVKANADVAVSEAFAASSAYTVAEAYNSNGELMNVNLNFSGATSEFALYQNVPNPFKGVTVIGFTLPEAATATLKVMDVSGKVLQVVSGDYAKGYNEVRLSNLSATGVLYYQLDTPTNSATRKMIILE